MIDKDHIEILFHLLRIRGVAGLDAEEFEKRLNDTLLASMGDSTALVDGGKNAPPKKVGPSKAEKKESPNTLFKNSPHLAFRLHDRFLGLFLIESSLSIKYLRDILTQINRQEDISDGNIHLMFCITKGSKYATSYCFNEIERLKEDIKKGEGDGVSPTVGTPPLIIEFFNSHDLIKIKFLQNSPGRLDRYFKTSPRGGLKPNTISINDPMVKMIGLHHGEVLGIPNEDFNGFSCYQVG